VFSPQYLIWAIPLLLLASVELLRTRNGWWLASAAVLAIAALTSWLFPHHYFNFRAVPFGLEPIPVPRERIALSFVIVGLRNAIYLSLIVALTMRLWRQEPITSGPPPVRARSRRGAARANPSPQPDR
jgi:hypothetical protein